MAYTIPPRLTSILTEVNRIAPGRRRSSDGTLGDAAHRASKSDHNPDGRGVVHAVDVSQSMPGTPYWKPGFAQFDAFAEARQIVAEYRAASPAERVRRFGWLKYMVWFEATLGYEVIFDPRDSLDVGPNGHPKIGHTEHLHISINAGAAENDTQPIFGDQEDDDVNDQDKKDIANQAGVVASRAVIAALKGDGTAKNPGLLNEAIANNFGGYVAGTWTPKALLGGLRKLTNLVK